MARAEISPASLHRFLQMAEDRNAITALTSFDKVKNKMDTTMSSLHNLVESQAAEMKTLREKVAQFESRPPAPDPAMLQAQIGDIQALQDQVKQLSSRPSLPDPVHLQAQEDEISGLKRQIKQLESRPALPEPVLDFIAKLMSNPPAVQAQSPLVPPPVSHQPVVHEPVAPQPDLHPPTVDQHVPKRPVANEIVVRDPIAPSGRCNTYSLSSRSSQTSADRRQARSTRNVEKQRAVKERPPVESENIHAEIGRWDSRMITFVDYFKELRRTYAANKPKSDHTYIWAFIEGIKDTELREWVQEKILLEECGPRLVWKHKGKDKRRSAVRVVVISRDLTWDDVVTAVKHVVKRLRAA